MKNRIRGGNIPTRESDFFAGVEVAIKSRKVAAGDFQTIRDQERQWCPCKNGSLLLLLSRRFKSLRPRFDHGGSQHSGRDCNDPQGTAGAADNFQRRGNDDGSGRWKLIKVAQTGQPKLTAAVHEVVIWKRGIESGGLSRIRTDCLHTKAEDISLLSEHGGTFFR